MIDINQPVEQGHDMILNYDGKEAKLGSAEGFEREAAKGLLNSLPPNDNPDGDPNQPKPVVEAPKRDKNGHFTKNS